MSKFDGKSFMTQGFATQIPLPVQLMILSMLQEHVKQSEQNGTEVDYLQVFELVSTGIESMTFQEIIHSQEEPSYMNKISFQLDEAITEKVFVIAEDRKSVV